MAEVREQGRVAKDEAGNLYVQLQQVNSGKRYTTFYDINLIEISLI